MSNFIGPHDLTLKHLFSAVAIKKQIVVNVEQGRNQYKRILKKPWLMFKIPGIILTSIM